jgi:hypothetical protein
MRRDTEPLAITSWLIMDRPLISTGEVMIPASPGKNLLESTLSEDRTSCTTAASPSQPSKPFGWDISCPPVTNRGAFRAPKDRRVLPTRSCALDREVKRACQISQDYTKSPPYLAMEAKRGDTFGQGASHCNKWAELQAKEAKEAEALATLHEDMAKTAGQKQQ